MKLLTVMATAFVMSAPAFAIDFVDMPSNIPSASQWAVGMVKIACNLNVNSAALRGTITQTNNGVVYKAFNDSKLVGAAIATNTTVFAKKACLTN